MITGLYKPVWIDALTCTGETINALTFDYDHEPPCYETESSAVTSAEFIFEAYGELGINSDYVEHSKSTQTIRRIEVNYVPSILLQFEQIDNMLNRKN